MDFIEVTKHIWNTYILENEQGNYDKVDGFAPECVVIGTGKHEVYRNLEEFSKALSMEAQERQDIRFQFKDFGVSRRKLPRMCTLCTEVCLSGGKAKIKVFSSIWTAVLQCCIRK